MSSIYCDLGSELQFRPAVEITGQSIDNETEFLELLLNSSIPMVVSRLISRNKPYVIALIDLNSSMFFTCTGNET